ncbi:hypothetical protein HMPREF9946_02201 [Acetobacteraceae bacterium AT-5844]|nr:hypothetical protein HMPREF9946_02201 [Acetobacteraceae bacterium AT-5844]
MTAYFREITPGLRGVSIIRPKGSDDLQDILDSIERRSANIDAKVDQLNDARRQMQERLDAGTFDGAILDDARAIDAVLAEAERALP